jgi:hypothetical protein
MPNAPAIPLDDAPAVFAAPPAAHGDGFEKRRAPRHLFDAPAQLVPWPASSRTAPIDVWVHDYSATGVGLFHAEPMRVGQKFILRQPVVTNGSSSCVYTVVRCDPRRDGRFSIGLHVSDTTEPEPYVTSSTDHIPPPARCWQFLYFLYALVGALTIVSVALLRWVHGR